MSETKWEIADERLMVPVSDEVRAVAETAERKARDVIPEPLVYTFDSRSSYYRDLALRVDGNVEAAERLERHERQFADAPQPEKRNFAGMEYRVNPSTTKGQGGEFAPPLWINELFATGRRPGEVIQRLAPTFDLPKGVSSVNLPRITQGTQASQGPDNSPVDDTPVETKAVESEVATGSGMSDWSLQALEQSPPGAHLDWVVFKDLTEALDAEIETEFIIGTGKGERIIGLTEVSGRNEITYTSVAPSGIGMMKFLSEAAAQVGVKRFRPPTAWLMNTSRFFWIAFSEDAQNRPLSIEDYPRSAFPNAGLGSVGVYFDDAISNELGAKKEQDTIIACRPEDWVLLMGEPKTAVYLDVLSGKLQARFQIHRSYAALLGRYPSSISTISGTGMTVQTGFK